MWKIMEMFILDLGLFFFTGPAVGLDILHPSKKILLYFFKKLVGHLFLYSAHLHGLRGLCKELRGKVKERAYLSTI